MSTQAFPGQYMNGLETGMDLRDWFAGQVLSSIAFAHFDLISMTTSDCKKLSDECYQVADAMMERRKQSHHTAELTDSLPDKWCIERTPENSDVVNEWATRQRDGNLSYTSNIGYIHSQAVHTGSWGRLFDDPQPGYAEITTDQFNRLVLKNHNHA